MAEPTGIVCGGTECPTCGRPSEVLIGPCNGCTERFHATGKFLRRVRAQRDSSPPRDDQRDGSKSAVSGRTDALRVDDGNQP